MEVGIVVGILLVHEIVSAWNEEPVCVSRIADEFIECLLQFARGHFARTQEKDPFVARLLYGVVVCGVSVSVVAGAVYDIASGLSGYVDSVVGASLVEDKDFVVVVDEFDRFAYVSGGIECSYYH